MYTAELLVDLLTVYTLFGVVFGTAFVIFGIHRVDPVATGAPFGFRLLVLPGAAALWPVLLVRWMRSTAR